jgi:hypothetical protein
MDDTTIVVTGERPEKTRAREVDPDEPHRVRRSHRVHETAPRQKTSFGEAGSWHNSSH